MLGRNLRNNYESIVFKKGIEKGFLNAFTTKKDTKGKSSMCIFVKIYKKGLRSYKQEMFTSS